MILKGAEHHLYSLLQDCTNMVLCTAFNHEVLLGGHQYIGPVVHVYSQHASLTNPSCKYTLKLWVLGLNYVASCMTACRAELPSWGTMAFFFYGT